MTSHRCLNVSINRSFVALEEWQIHCNKIVFLRVLKTYAFDIRHRPPANAVASRWVGAFGASDTDDVVFMNKFLTRVTKYGKSSLNSASSLATLPGERMRGIKRFPYFKLYHSLQSVSGVSTWTERVDTCRNRVRDGKKRQRRTCALGRA